MSTEGIKPTRILDEGYALPDEVSIDGDYSGDDVDWDDAPGMGGQDQWKQPVRCATTASITIATALNAADVIDGVTLAAGDRVLVKDQAAAAENGIYVVGATPARAADMDDTLEVLGAVVYVIAGTVNAGSIWTVTNTTAPVVDTDAINWAAGEEPALTAHLADTTDAHDASAVSVLDTGGYFAGTDVEAVLAEIGLQDANDTSLVTVAATGATETVDVSVARTYDLTLDANCTISLSGAVTAEAWYATIVLRQDATGSRTVTWPGALTWVNGSAPTLQTAPNAVDVVTVFTLNGGTTWYGAAGDSSVSAHLADTTDAHDASAISIADAGAYYTSTDVEGALQEIGAGGIGGGGGGEDTTLVKDTAAGATQTVDCSLARMHDLTLTANCTITLAGAVAGEYHYVRVILRQDATGSRTVTWPASVYWPSGGSAPTLATGAYDADIVHLMTTDGGVEWYGHLEAAAYALSAPPSGTRYWPMLALTSN